MKNVLLDLVYTPMTLFAVFIASLFGSLHCAGMCGGFVTLYASQSNNSALSHIAYNIGRCLTYCLVGAAAGVLGQQVNLGGALVGIQELAVLITGCLMIWWGVRAWFSGGLSLDSDPKSPGFFSIFQKPLKFILKTHGERAAWLQAFLLGVVTTLLPCGWLYMWVAVAAASADPLLGAATMLFFWAGTLPVMLSLGAILGGAFPMLRRQMPKLIPLLLLIAGSYSIYSHFTMKHEHHHHHHAHN